MQFTGDGQIRNTDRFGDLMMLIMVADHRFDRVTLMSGQAAISGHFSFTWMFNQKPHIAPGLLPSLPIALAS